MDFWYGKPVSFGLLVLFKEAKRASFRLARSGRCGHLPLLPEAADFGRHATEVLS